MLSIRPIRSAPPYVAAPAYARAQAPVPDYEPSPLAALYDPNRIAHLSSALNQTNALWQHNVLGQTGIRSEHVGILVVFGQYAAKAASLPAVMEAVWLSPDYASLAETKRQLMLGGGWDEGEHPGVLGPLLDAGNEPAGPAERGINLLA